MEAFLQQDMHEYADLAQSRTGLARLLGAA